MDKNDLSLFPSRVERCNRHKFKVSVIFFSSCIYSINIWDIGENCWYSLKIKKISLITKIIRYRNFFVLNISY